jgi:hypothetical protein
LREARFELRNRLLGELRIAVQIVRVEDCSEAAGRLRRTRSSVQRVVQKISPTGLMRG